MSWIDKNSNFPCVDSSSIPINLSTKPYTTRCIISSIMSLPDESF